MNSDERERNERQKRLEYRLQRLLSATPLHATQVNVAKFNELRVELRQCTLMEYHLPILYNLKCEGIDLEETRVRDIKQCCLDRANLRYSVWDYVSIKETSLRCADLRYAAYFLSKVDVRGVVDLQYADLRGIRLDRDYREYTQKMLFQGKFHQTRITPEQEKQLVTEFGIPQLYLALNFIVVPLSREEEANRRLGQRQELWQVRRELK